MLDVMDTTAGRPRKKKGGGGGTNASPTPSPTPAAYTQLRVAFQRFGLGAKPGGPARIGTTTDAAKRACLAELATPGIAALVDPTLPTYATACATGTAGFTPANDMANVELRARYARHMVPEIGFVERLVLFWSNHFSMNRSKSDTVRATIGQFERDVIRRHVLGKFPDMIAAVYQHPAMITYLDNQGSIGPNSIYGKAAKRSYNENLARECLELHTLGAGGPYTQTDVTTLAKVLTGWSYVDRWQADNGWQGANQGNLGQFLYRPTFHEPGAFTILGKTYPAGEQAQGLAVLRDLALHPSTAQHLAYRMLVHFVGDQPTAAMVKTLADAYTRSGGDLKAMATALINLPVAWTTPLSRLRTPHLAMIAQMRAVGGFAVTSSNEWNVGSALSLLNHAPWQCLTPDGYPDESFNWINPDAVRTREDTAYMFAGLVQPTYSGMAPAVLARDLYPGTLSINSLHAVALWPDVRRGLATLFMTPEFLRS